MPEVANASSINGLACSPQGAGFGLCVPNGYDTAISLPASVLGSGSQPEFQLQRRVSSGSAGQMWTSTLCVSARAGAQINTSNPPPPPPLQKRPIAHPRSLCRCSRGACVQQTVGLVDHKCVHVGSNLLGDAWRLPLRDDRRLKPAHERHSYLRPGTRGTAYVDNWGRPGMILAFPATAGLGVAEWPSCDAANKCHRLNDRARRRFSR